MAESFARLLGRPLLPGVAASDLPRALYAAPFVLLSHDNAPDPVFRYANQAAQALFGYAWDRFTTLPSRLSAEPVSAAERETLLARARAHGFIDDYQGIRIAADGHRFRIQDVILWNLTDATGTYLGQAAMFAHWSNL